MASGFAFVPQTVPGCLGIGWLSNRLVKQVGNMLRLYIPCADRTPGPTDKNNAAGELCTD
jgi:hypothetical protein